MAFASYAVRFRCGSGDLVKAVRQLLEERVVSGGERFFGGLRIGGFLRVVADQHEDHSHENERVGDRCRDAFMSPDDQDEQQGDQHLQDHEPDADMREGKFEKPAVLDAGTRGTGDGGDDRNKDRHGGKQELHAVQRVLFRTGSHHHNAEQDG